MLNCSKHCSWFLKFDVKNFTFASKLEVIINKNIVIMNNNYSLWPPLNWLINRQFAFWAKNLYKYFCEKTNSVVWTMMIPFFCWTSPRNLPAQAPGTLLTPLWLKQLSHHKKTYCSFRKKSFISFFIRIYNYFHQVNVISSTFTRDKLFIKVNGRESH